MIFTRGLRVCLAAQPADLRRGFEGLALLVRGALQEDERSSQIFVFTNKRRDRIRLLYWDGTGLWMLTKKLGAGTFAWPKVPEGAAKIALRVEALEMLLSGIDLKGARLRPWYEDPTAASQLGKRSEQTPPPVPGQPELSLETENISITCRSTVRPKRWNGKAESKPPRPRFVRLWPGSPRKWNPWSRPWLMTCGVRLASSSI